MGMFKVAVASGIKRASSEEDDMTVADLHRAVEVAAGQGQGLSTGLVGGGIMGGLGGHGLAALLGRGSPALPVAGAALGAGLGGWAGYHAGGDIAGADHDEEVARILDNPHSARAHVDHPMRQPLISAILGAGSGGALGLMLAGAAKKNPMVYGGVGAGLGGLLGGLSRMNQRDLVEDVLSRREQN